jgi:hypothetical protein
VLQAAKARRLAEAPPLPFEVDDIPYMYEYGDQGGEG